MRNNLILQIGKCLCSTNCDKKWFSMMTNVVGKGFKIFLVVKINFANKNVSECLIIVSNEIAQASTSAKRDDMH